MKRATVRRIRARTLDRKLLRDINKIRVATNQEPLTEILPGHPGDRFSCPIAKSINLGMAVGGATITRVPDPRKVGEALGTESFGFGMVTMTPRMIRFVGRFDRKWPSVKAYRL